MKIDLYPLKFEPIFKYYLWGGTKLKSILNKKDKEDRIAESWEISNVEGNETKVMNGPLIGKTIKNLIKMYGSDFLGKSVQNSFKNEFPLLIKFIDSEKPLSIQVHPNDEIARKRHKSFGKNEMWYIMDAEEDAELLLGFNQGLSVEKYKDHLEKDSILDVLNKEIISVGDAFYIPAGRIHAVGKGVTLAEIQQTSDITYRIYDYKRIDKRTGKTRELHNELTYDVIDFKTYDSYGTTYEEINNVPNKLVHSPFFKSNIFIVSEKMERDYSNMDSFVIYICVKGKLTIKVNDQDYCLEKGETILLPSTIDHVEITSPMAKLLEVYI